MKNLVLAAAITALLCGAAEAQTAPSGMVCLHAPLIDHTKTVNPSTVLFYMKDGKVWQANLATPCNGLNLHGFVMAGHHDQYCAGQGITIIATSQVCTFRDFTPYMTPVPENHM